MSEPTEVFESRAHRHAGRVHLTVRTSHGPATLSLTPAAAQLLGRELGVAAIEPARAPADDTQPFTARRPIVKPNGGIL